MNKLKTFFNTFKRSASDPSYYKDILKAKFSFSLKYLYMLSFFIILVTVLKFALMFAIALPTLTPKIQEFKKNMQTAYPAELEVKINNGELSTNVEEPYYFDPFDMKGDDGKSQYEHFITIDTEASVEDYESYQSAILLTRTAAVYPDNQSGTYNFIKFSEFKEPIAINKSLYDEMMKKASPLIDAVPMLLTGLIILMVLFGPLIGGVFTTAGYMLYLLLATLVTWIVAKLFKTNLGYSKVYQLGMHGITLSVVITTILGLFGKDIPLIFSGIFFLWMAIVLSKLSDEKAQPEPTVAETGSVVTHTHHKKEVEPVVITDKTKKTE